MKLKVILSITFLLFFSPEIYSMSGCLKVSPLFQLKQSAVVFSGEVIAIEYQANEGTQVELQRARIKTQKWWKGNGSHEVLVDTGWARKPNGRIWETFGAMFAYKFTVGESYLIYAFNQVFQGGISTNRCKRTNTLSNADFDLRELREGFLPNTIVQNNSLDLPDRDSY